jgi:hypothetical protein
MMKKPWKANRRLPKTVLAFLLNHGAWLVGSSVDWYLAGGQEPVPRDFDVMLPPREWQPACRIIRGRVKFNSMGGIKFTEAGAEVDVWPQHLDDFFTNSTRTKGSKALRLRPWTLVEDRTADLLE